MSDLNLERAISEIIQACQPTEGGKSVRPFVFIVGAGLSAPSVPLSASIVEHCKKEAAKYGRTEDPKLQTAIDIYSHWFDRAFPNAVQRQQFLRELIQDKPISPASFRLAHCLLSGKVANVVVTPNFDDLVSRALALFGRQHRICDHPSTVERIDPESEEIQIVHVHGSYWFYDCCNLRGEIEGRAQNQGDAPSMASLLDGLLARRAPIVIGYSGWEGDVIMSALKRRLKRALPYNVYWFGHTRHSVDSLPDWLRDHSQVRLIFQTSLARNLAATGIASNEAVGEARATEPGVRDSALTARQIIDHIIHGLTISAPELTSSPVTFLAKSLKGSLSLDDVDPTEDFYSLREVIGRLERAAHWDESEGAVATDALRQVRDALSRSQYREAIRIGASLSVATLTSDDRLELMRAMWSASTGLSDNSTDELDGYASVVKLGNTLIRVDPTNIPVARLLGRALVYQGLTLSALNRSEDAIAAYNDHVRQFRDAVDDDLRVQVAKALLNQGLALGTLDRSEEAIAAYDEVLRRFGEAGDVALQDRVARALFNKGVTLAKLGRREEAIAAYDEVLRRFGEAAEAALQDIVARALLNKGVTLDRSEEAIAAYNELLRRFGDATEPQLREQVAKALFNKGATLGMMGRSEEELTAYDEVSRRFGDAADPALREQVAKALFNKAETHAKFDRSREAFTAFDDVVRRFGELPDEASREYAARALLNKGAALAAWGRNEEALAAYDELVRQFGDSADATPREMVASALLNKSVVLMRLDRKADAIANYDEIVRRFGDAVDVPSREAVAKALYSNGVSFAALDRNDKAIAAYDEVLRRFGDAPDDATRQYFAKALVNKGTTLARSHRKEEAIVVFDEVVRRFGESPDATPRESVAKALLNKGVTLATLNRNEVAIAAYEEVLRRYSDVQETSIRNFVSAAREALAALKAVPLPGGDHRGEVLPRPLEVDAADAEPDAGASA